MEEVPPEIGTIIACHCDFASLVNLRQVNSFMSGVATNALKKWSSLDINKHYIQQETCCSSEESHPLNMDKICDFLYFNIPQLTNLSLRGAPIHISLSGLIQLSNVLPNLLSIDLSQDKSWPVFDREAVYGLPYFRNLTHLKMNGWKPSDTVRRGCCHRVDVLPVRQLQKLYHLELECERDSVSTLLTHMHKGQIVLPRLSEIKLGERLANPQLCEHLIWFISNHLKLTNVIFHNVLFATMAQLRQFYRALLALPNLKSVCLVSCTVVERMDSSVNTQFLRTTVLRNIHVNGLVRSMRFDPNNSS